MLSRGRHTTQIPGYSNDVCTVRNCVCIYIRGYVHISYAFLSEHSSGLSKGARGVELVEEVAMACSFSLLPPEHGILRKIILMKEVIKIISDQKQFWPFDPPVETRFEHVCYKHPPPRFCFAAVLSIGRFWAEGHLAKILGTVILFFWVILKFMESDTFVTL